MTQKAIVLDYFVGKFLQTQKFLPLEMYIYIVRTNFDLNPEQEWNQAQKTRTINL